MNCIIDASLKSIYYTIGLWGKPVVYYPIKAAIESHTFDKVYVVSQDSYTLFLIKQYFGNQVFIIDDFPDSGIYIDGRAALLTPDAISNISGHLTEGSILFNYLDDEEQTAIVCSPMMFELALAILHKRERSTWLKESVAERIYEKRNILLHPFKERSICFIGHSQLDQWQIEKLGPYKVRNCGISGITTDEYLTEILEKDLLSFQADAFLVLIGINDMALQPEDTADHINNLIIKIKENSLSPMSFS